MTYAAVGFGLFLLLGLIGLACPSKPGSDARKLEAWQVSKQFVREGLKSPTSATFPSYNKAFVFEISKEPEIYEVRAYVDASNSFGAVIRSDWSVKIRATSNTKWVADDVKIDAR